MVLLSMFKDKETADKIERKAKLKSIKTAKKDKSPGTYFFKQVVMEEYVKDLQEAVFLYENLILQNNITVIASPAAGGKTAICFYLISGLLAENGYFTIYVDLDSQTSDHKKMYEYAIVHGVLWVNPHTHRGENADTVLESLQETIEDESIDLSKTVIFIDTLKKFADLMSKKRVKIFFEILRDIVARGATIVILAHTNKFKIDGELIFEGVGDVMNDCDNLIYLYKIKRENYLLASTEPSDKVRGIFKRISFKIYPSREVVQLSQHLDIKKYLPIKDKDDDEILDALVKVISDSTEPLAQTQIVERAKSMCSVGVNKIRKVLLRYSRGPAGIRMFKEHDGRNFSKLYTLCNDEPE